MIKVCLKSKGFRLNEEVGVSFRNTFQPNINSLSLSHFEVSKKHKSIVDRQNGQDRIGRFHKEPILGPRIYKENTQVISLI